MEGLYQIWAAHRCQPARTLSVDMSAAFLKLCHAQTMPENASLQDQSGAVENLLDDVLSGDANLDTIFLVEKTARVIVDTADCAIGYEAANMVLKRSNRIQGGL